MSRFFDILILDGASGCEEILCRMFLAFSLGFSLGVESNLQLSRTQEFLELLQKIQEENKDV